jgi:hypothetical protein
MEPEATVAQSVHLIQVALTPIFLLSGIAALLNVYAGRLARVADRLDALATPPGETADEAHPGEVSRLRTRLGALDVAVILATVAAAATCFAILTLFISALSDRAVGGLLLLFFGAAVVFTLGSVIAFGLEMMISSGGLRLRMRR